MGLHCWHDRGCVRGERCHPGRDLVAALNAWSWDGTGVWNAWSLAMRVRCILHVWHWQMGALLGIVGPRLQGSSVLQDAVMGSAVECAGKVGDTGSTRGVGISVYAAGAGVPRGNCRLLECMFALLCVGSCQGDVLPCRRPLRSVHGTV